MMNINSKTQRPIVFYDGGCPLCQREIAHYRRLDRNRRIDWVDIYARPGSLQAYGVPWSDAMQRIHLREVDGRMVTGAYAFAALWKRLPYYRIVAGLVALPGMLRLLDKAYIPFARWRWKRRCNQACVGNPMANSDGPQSTNEILRSGSGH